MRLAMRRDMLYTTGAQISIQAIGLVSGILVARWLGPDGRGQLAAIIGWASLFAYLGNLGQPSAIAFSSAREPARRRELFGNAFVLSVGQFVVLSLVGLLVFPLVLGKFGEAAVQSGMLYLFVFLPLNAITLCSLSILQGAGRFKWFSLVRISVPVAYVAGLLGCFLVGRIDVNAVLLASIASNVVALLFVLLGLLPMLVGSDFNGLLWFNLRGIKGELKYGLAAHIGTLQPFSGMRLDVLVLSLMASASDLGLYAAALAAAGLLQAQAIALGHVVLPEVARTVDPQRQLRTIRKFALLAAVGGALAWLCVLLGAKELLRLVYGPAYEPASNLLKVVVLGGAISAVQRVVADGARGMGLPLLSTISELVSLGVGLLGLFLFVPSQGAFGAAVAITAASACSLAVLLLLMASARRQSAPPGLVAQA